MIVSITLINLNENQVIYKGQGEIENISNGRKISFKDDTHTYTWNIYDKGMTLRSLSEVDVHLTFRENAKTKGHIESPYGIMDVSCQTYIYKPQLNRVELQYDLIMDQNIQPFHFILEIEQEILHEIH